METITLSETTTIICFAIPITQDAIYEDDQTFLVGVASDDPAVTIGIGSIEIVIEDDDFGQCIYFTVPEKLYCVFTHNACSFSINCFGFLLQLSSCLLILLVQRLATSSVSVRENSW